MFENVGPIYLLRHGETVWNAERRKQGLDDSPLTKLGGRQAKAYAKVLGLRLTQERVSMEDVLIYVSPLGRTKGTAQYLIDKLLVPAENIRYESRLIEFDYGEWSGLTNNDIEQAYPGELERREGNKWFYTVPGGESYADVERKVGEWAAELPQGKTIVVMTHSVVSRVIRGKYLGLSYSDASQLDHSQNLFFRLWDQRSETIDVDHQCSEL